MDIQKEFIGNTVSCGKKRTVIISETDVIVPDTKPDAEKIVTLYANAILSGYEVQNGRVLVYGTVKFNVLYYSPEGEVKNVRTEAPFTDVLEMPGAEPSCTAAVTAKILKSECRILNGRKLSVKASVEVTAEIFKEEEFEVVSKIECRGLEQLNKKVSFIRKNPLDVQLFMVNEQSEIADDLPSIYEVLQAEGKITNKNFKIISNKIILKADLDIKVFYTDEERHAPCVATISLPFTEITELDGINEEWILLNDVSVLYTNCEVSEDINGNARILELETAIESRSQTYVPYSFDILCDCYAVGKKAETVNTNTRLLMKSGDVNFQTGLKTGLETEESIGSIQGVSATCSIYGVERGDKELFAKGKACVKILYITEDGKILCTEKETDFKESLKNVPEFCDEAEIQAQISGLSYTVTGDKMVEVRGNLELMGILTQYKNEMFITAVSLSEKENLCKSASLTVYFVQPNENLWDIAKRYETSADLICEANGIKQNEISAGEKIIIPKYKAHL